MIKKGNSYYFSLFLGTFWSARIPRASWTTRTSRKLRIADKCEKIPVGSAENVCGFFAAVALSAPFLGQLSAGCKHRAPRRAVTSHGLHFGVLIISC